MLYFFHNFQLISTLHFRAYLTVESVGDQLKAVVTDFDKRHAGSKYYVSIGNCLNFCMDGCVAMVA